MIGHIFRKDVRLLWPAAAGVALLNALRVGLTGQVREPVITIVSGLSVVAALLLVAIVVQTDPLPGVRQDWLVRPIRRTDLMLSKLAFVALLVVLPVFVCDLIHGLALQLPPLAVLAAAARQNLGILIWSFGMVAFATLTASLIEALGAGLVAGLCAGLLMEVSETLPGITTTGLAWIAGLLLLACIAAGAAAIVSLQYHSRKTVLARWVCGAAIVLAVLTQSVPWTPAFALQERLSPQPDAAPSVRLILEPAPRKVIVQDWFPNSQILLPVERSGLGRDQQLITDHLDARLVNRDGRIDKLDPRIFTGGFFDSEYQSLVLRRGIALKTARLELDYSLTLLNLSGYRVLPLDGSTPVEGLGRCEMHTDLASSEVDVSCRAAGPLPCTTITLKGLPVLPRQGRAYQQVCRPDYAPWFADLAAGDINSLRTSFPFAGPETPEQQAQLRNAHLEVRTYRPIAHFTRHLTVPESRLNEAEYR